MSRSKEAGNSRGHLLLPERKRRLRLYMLNAVLSIPHDFLYVVARSKREAKDLLEEHVQQEIKKSLRSEVEDLTFVYPELLRREPFKVFSDTE